MMRGRLVRRGGQTLAVLCLLLLACGLRGQGAVQGDATLPTLTHVVQAHSLSPTEAKRHYPVHLHATVTYYDPFIDPRHGALFIEDASGGIFVSVPEDAIWPDGPPTAGSLVDVTGVSSPGDFASVVIHPQVRILSRGQALPAARRTGISDLLTGTQDCRWVFVEGVVQSISVTAENVALQISLTDGRVGATTIKVPGVNYEHLVDARVRLYGVVAPLFNKDRQMIGARMFFPGLDQVTVLEFAPPDAFVTPPVSIENLSRITTAASMVHRAHVRGTVTLQWPGHLICVQDATQGVCAQSSQETVVPVGRSADVVGFVSIGGYRPSLLDAVYQAREGEHPVAATAVTAQQALTGDKDAELVQIEGKLIGRDLAAHNNPFVLLAGNLIFTISLPPGFDAGSLDAIADGSTLLVKGICSVQMDHQRTQEREGTAVTNSFRILLRGPTDIVVLKAPPFWTVRRVLRLTVLLLVVMAAVLGWVLVLRRRVEQQTRLIRESEERFRRLAQHDTLTGLPSRLLLHDRLSAALRQSAETGSRLALLMIDFDNFKLINDSLGHHAGDQLLCIAAERMVSAVRGTDTIARMGGDEFIILLCDLQEDAEHIAARIVMNLHEPMKIGVEELSASVSVGVCHIIDPNIAIDDLLKNADIAMYAAKSSGRNCFQVFSSEMAGASLRALQLRLGLAHALQNDEFCLHYQPLIDFGTGDLIGFEALARWNSRELGAISPAEFIPVAEESELIVFIGQWVMQEACREVALLEQELGRSFSLSVNLSARQFLHQDLTEMIRGTLAEHKRAPGSLRVEITESTLVSDSLCAQEALDGIRGLGVQLAIDDFGIGFSTLSYITRFPLDWIKIDRSLICNCTTDPSSVAVLRAIVTMAHGLGIRVVAEGVEQPEQYMLLKAEQCDVAQGFYFSRPVAAADLAGVVRGYETGVRSLPPPRRLPGTHRSSRATELVSWN